MAVYDTALVNDALLFNGEIIPEYSKLRDSYRPTLEARSILVGSPEHIIDVHGYTSSVLIRGHWDNAFGIGGTDWIISGSGHDSIYAYSGNDAVRAGFGNDMVRGGHGEDTLYGEYGNDRMYGDMGHDALYGQQGNDTMRGGIGQDMLSGGGGDDTLYGEADNDNLFGGYGRDVLSGGDGKDTLNGGRNWDVMTGGRGADKFIFNSVFDSFNDGANVDTITDFSRPEGDKIDLHLIDASLAAAGDQSFQFLGSGNFSGAQGELIVSQSNNVTTIRGDIDGDRVADFQLKLAGNITLYATDFIL